MNPKKRHKGKKKLFLVESALVELLRHQEDISVILPVNWNTLPRELLINLPPASGS